VLIAKANVPYDKLIEVEEINRSISWCRKPPFLQTKHPYHAFRRHQIQHRGGCFAVQGGVTAT